MPNSACERLAFPLDVATLREAEGLIDQLSDHVGVFKVGLELFTAEGPAAVRAVHARRRRCFLDLKLHDIPTTVSRAVATARDLGVAYLTLHAANGPEALREAVAAAGAELKLLAVTVLTSMDATALSAIGMQGPPAEAVSRLAGLATAAGIKGLVCSATECAQLREQLGPSVFLVTPGIRPAGSAVGDQRRIATAAAAIASGADLLVVGRPIRDALDPKAAAAEIVAEIERAAR
ncbi:MAG TPA: orotidine-5'-phosphate decarboxylase [Polyangiales bacterium]